MDVDINAVGLIFGGIRARVFPTEREVKYSLLKVTQQMSE